MKHVRASLFIPFDCQTDPATFKQSKKPYLSDL